MRCLVCEKWSLSHLCRQCQKSFIVPNPKRRTLECGLEVVSFFAYDEIDFLLTTKHQDLGYYIYKILAKKTMIPLQQAFKSFGHATVIPVDDRVKNGFAHTAVIARYLASKWIKVRYAVLHARNHQSYAGQSLAFRLAHPREFFVKKKLQESLILVDDIVTTGTTLCEAKKVIEQSGASVVLAVVLADASR